MSLMTRAQHQSELDRCEYCEEKPCRDACPATCSPADFIMAARIGAPSDYARAAGLILSHNPMGATCGITCPDTHCMAACTRTRFDRSIEIPACQTSIIMRAKELGLTPSVEEPDAETGKRVAIIGGGPAGLVNSYGNGKVIYLAFGLEAVDGKEMRGWLLRDLISRLKPGVKDQVQRIRDSYEKNPSLYSVLIENLRFPKKFTNQQILDLLHSTGTIEPFRPILNQLLYED